VSRRSLLAIVGASLLITSGCGGGDDSSDETGVTEAIEGFVTALETGDPSAACASLAAATLEDLEVADSCDEVMTEAIALLDEKQVDIPDYEITDVTIDGDTAEATLISDATEDTVPLVKEDGEWLLLGTTAMTQIHPDAPLESDSGIGEVDG